MLLVTNDQIKKIKTLQGRLGIDDDTYREILFNNYNVNTCKKLNRKQAKEILDAWSKDAEKQGNWTNHKKSFQKHKYDNLGYRKGMASPKQLRMIEAIWKDVSYVQDEKARLEALDTFLSKHFGVDNIIWIESGMIQKIKHTLEKMKAQKAQKEEIK